MSFTLLVPAGLTLVRGGEGAPRVYEGRGAAAARGDAGASEVEVKEDAPVELAWADGTEVIVLGKDLAARAGDRSPGGAVRVPRLGATRDGGGSVLTKVVVGLVAEPAAEAVAGLIDAKMAGRAAGAGPGEELGGLRIVGADGVLGPLGGTGTGGETLLLVHGTFSNAAGSFADLYGSPDWRDIHELYKGGALAFEHPTLSRDPVQNVVRLVGLLPPNAKLTVVSHSRGGLVADVLAAACRPGAAVDARAALDRAKAGKAATDRNGEWLLRVREAFLVAAEQAAARGISVERTVRVAAPSRGTSLAGSRLDTWLNVFLNVVGLIPALRASPIYDGVKEALTAFLRERENPLSMPGLAAMIPGGVFVRWLGGQLAQDELVVLAGDASRAGFLERLKTLLFELYYPGANDWVVDTDSMDGGARRVRTTGADALPRVHALEDKKTPRIHHLCYFSNEEVRRVLRAELTLPDGAPVRRGSRAIGGYIKDAVAGRGVYPMTPKGSREAVIVVPGIMGSVLTVGGQEVWPVVTSLASGRFGELGIDGPGVTASAILAGPYERIVRHLEAGGRDVWVQPFDWRRSVQDAAAILAGTIDAAVATAGGEPVHILAHSMGGLVARGVLAWHPETWARFTAKGGRLVMAGTPNHGSYVIPRLLLGLEPVFRQLAVVDLEHDEAQLLALIRAFPGVAEMLPADPEADLAKAPLFSLRGWKQPWPHAGDALERARVVRSQLAAAVDPAHMVYVAGTAAATPSDIEWKDSGPVFAASDAGDGRVLWSHGWLRDVRMWRMRAEHGALLDQPRTFDALVELLTQGSTRELPTLEVGRTRERSTATLVDRPVLYPSDAALEAAAVGGRGELPAEPILVGTVHGDLALGTGPEEPVLAVIGHFEGGRLRGAEPSLDLAFGGALSARVAARRFPSAVGEALAIRNPHHQPSDSVPYGALVVGLGRIARLTRTRLVEALVAGIVELSFPPSDTVAERPGTRPGSAPPPLRLAFALPGCAPEGLTVSEGVSAALEALIQANRLLRARGVPEDKLCSDVRFVTPFGDQAGEALRAARRWLDAPAIELEPGERLEVARTVRPGKQLEGSPPPERPLRSRTRSRWRRLSARAVRPAGKERSGPVGVEYVLPGDGAAAERRILDVTWPTVLALASELTQRAELVEPRIRALRAHVVPLSVIGELESGVDVQLGLDRVTATLPWEAFVAAGVDAEATLSGQIAILRQLEDARPLGGGTPVDRGSALLVCSPGAGASYLPAAGREADIVRRKLLARRFSVDEPGPGAGEIRQSLSGQFEVVHVVAHGSYKAGDVGKTGFYAAGEEVVSRHDLRAFEDAPPALVFLNCCHLGQLDAEGAGLDDRSPLAADLAGYLIGAGVRAVVAAGWAVNDDAACAFADTLYGQLLAGETFREAVAAARVAARAAAPETATWAAYQCYGDPDFVLPSAITARGGLDDELGTLLTQADVVSPAETEAVIGQVVGRLQLTPWDTSARARMVEAAWAFYRDLPACLRSGATEYRMARLLSLHPRATEPQVNDRVRLCLEAATKDPYAPADAWARLGKGPGAAEGAPEADPGQQQADPGQQQADPGQQQADPGQQPGDRGLGGDLRFVPESALGFNTGSGDAGGLPTVSSVERRARAGGSAAVMAWRELTAKTLTELKGGSVVAAEPTAAVGRTADLLAPAERELALAFAADSTLAGVTRPTAEAVVDAWRAAAGDGMDTALAAEVRGWVSRVLLAAGREPDDRFSQMALEISYHLRAGLPRLLDDPLFGSHGLRAQRSGWTLTTEVRQTRGHRYHLDAVVTGPNPSVEVAFVVPLPGGPVAYPTRASDGRWAWSGTIDRVATVAAAAFVGGPEVRLEAHPTAPEPESSY